MGQRPLSVKPDLPSSDKPGAAHQVPPYHARVPLRRVGLRVAPQPLRRDAAAGELQLGDTTLLERHQIRQSAGLVFYTNPSTPVEPPYDGSISARPVFRS